MEAIRTIHHLAAAGGTIMSKALAAQPSVILLSEISPSVGPLKFNPFDPVQQFIRNYLSKDPELLKGHNRGRFARRVLSDRIRLVHEIACVHNRILIVRDHAHSDFMLPVPRERSTLLLALEEANVPVTSIATVRDPVDTWLSGEPRGWNEGAGTFDEYCRRFLMLTSAFDAEDVFRYEDFVFEPQQITAQMCERLTIAFDPAFQARIADIALTGDSGRTSNDIGPRDRKPLSRRFLEEASASANYRLIGDRFQYRL